MNPTLLSNCGAEYVIDEKDKYTVIIQSGDYLVISMGFATSHGGSRFKHPNIAATTKTIHEFKHYRNSGSKFWTSRAGIDHILVIPRDKITLLPEKGYSYISAEINGAKVKFNVSGGTSGDGGWSDYLGTFVHISVNHKVGDLKKLCEVAVRNSPFEPIEVKKLDENDEKRWNRLMANSIPDYKEKIAKMIEEGKQPMIQLTPGLRYVKEKAVDIRRRTKRVPITENSWKYEETGAPRRIIIDVGYKVAVKMNQIDWHKTAVENNLA